MFEFTLKKDQLVLICFRTFQAFRKTRRAVTAIEYALIAGIITIAIVSSVLTSVSPSLNRTFNTISSEL